MRIRGPKIPLWEWVVGGLILALPALLLFPFPQPPHDGRIELTRLVIRSSFRPPLEYFRLNVGRFPTTQEGLKALLIAPDSLNGRWSGPYYSGAAVPFDPWGLEFRYRSPGLHNPQSYDLWSLGPDGVESADDIGNW